MSHHLAVPRVWHLDHCMLFTHLGSIGAWIQLEDLQSPPPFVSCRGDTMLRKWHIDSMQIPCHGESGLLTDMQFRGWGELCMHLNRAWCRTWEPFERGYRAWNNSPASGQWGWCTGSELLYDGLMLISANPLLSRWKDKSEIRCSRRLAIQNSMYYISPAPRLQMKVRLVGPRTTAQ